MTAIQPIIDEDEMIRRLMAAGATDEEIVILVREARAKRQAGTPTPQPAAPQPPAGNQTFLGQEAGEALRGAGQALGGLGRGFLQGAGESLRKTGAFLTQTGLRLNDPTATVKTPSLPPVSEQETPAAQAGLTLGRMGGQLVGEAPLYAATSGIINPIAARTTGKLLGPAAAKAARKLASSEAMQKAVEVGITTIPQEIIAGSIAEGIIRPESFGTWQGALRTGILSSVGSLFNAGFAYSAAIKNAKTLSELTEIQKQIDAVVPPTEPANTQLLTAQELATQRQYPTQQGGQLPSAYEAGWRRIQQRLQEEAELRAAQLQNVKPKTELDVLQLAAAKAEPEVDPILDAALGAVDKDINDWLQRRVVGQPVEGKGVQTNTVPDLGVRLDERDFLTYEELKKHLAILNMASVMGQPKFKKGQRIVIPKFELPTAEEIAARATGGPIKAIDKTVQQRMLDVQRRLDEAVATRGQVADMADLEDLAREMLDISRRLRNGFEVPRRSLEPRVQGPVSPAATKNVEGWDLPQITKINEPGFGESAKDDTYKLWVTGSDAPEGVPQTAPEIQQAKAVTYADATRNVKETISYSPQKNSFFDRMKTFVSDIRPNIFNRAEFAGRYNKATQDMMEALSGISTYADEFYNNQMRIAVKNPDGTIGQRVVEGRTLGQMLKSLSDNDIMEFDVYLKARTSLEQKAVDENFKLDRPIEEFQVIVENAPDNIKALGDEFKVISDALVDDAVALGRLAESSAEKMKAKYYAGLSRVFNNATLQQSLMRRTGSLRQSISPVQLMRDNIYNMLNRSRRNYAFSRLVEDYKKDPLKYNGIMEPAEVKAGLYELPGYKEMVDNFQKEAGLPLKDAEDLAALMAPSLDRSDKALLVYDQGKMTFWRVNDDIKKAIESFNPIEIGIWQSLLSGFSRARRSAVSISLDLSGVGPVADMILTTARTPQYYPWDSLRGLFHSALKTDMYQESIAALRGYGSQYLKGEDIIPMGRGAQFVRRGGDIIASPLAILQAIVRPLADASRMGEYLVRRQKLGQDAMMAALGSRRTLGDYNRVGALMRGWSLVTEFGNVGIQSADAAREFAKEVVGAARKGDTAPLVRAVTTFAAAITAPTLYFWAASQGDKELEAKRKSKTGYRYWWTRMPFDVPGTSIKKGDIVKSQKLGWWAGQMFGSSLEMILDGMDADAQKRFADGVLSQVGINTLPLTVTSIAGLATDTRNLDWSMALGLTDRVPITPRAQQGLLPIIQGDERTTALGAMGSKIGLNPFKVDYALDAFGGSLFSSVVRNLSNNPVNLEKSDLPIYGRFFVSSKASTEGSEMFYDDLTKAQEADKSFRRAVQLGNVSVAEKILTANTQLIAQKQQIEAMAAQISEMNSLILTIANDETLSPEGKREYINNIRSAQQEIFAAYAEFKKRSGLK